jgi:hypothetical protein
MTLIALPKFFIRTRPLYLLGLLLCIAASACSSAGHVLSPSNEFKAEMNLAKTRPRPDVSIEQLESDSSYLPDLDQESRAVEFSEFWYEHGISLERTSVTGAFSAFARSAHTALQPLLGERCRTPFHPPCSQLDIAYKRALQGLINLLARNGWNYPDLERTRYDMDKETKLELDKLRQWQIHLDSSATDLMIIRPGIGLPTVGCRQLRQNDTACSPLTFIATFSSPLSSERVKLSLRAIDAYQQEIVAVDSTQLPLAAAIDQTATTLGELAKGNPDSALYCLSLPTTETTTVVAIVQNTEALAIAKNLWIPLLKDDGLRLTSSFCLQTLRESLSDNRNVRELLESLRGAHSAANGIGISTPHHLAMSIISVGERAKRVGLLLASRASRAKGPRNRNSSVETIFDTHSMIVIGKNQEAGSKITKSGIHTTYFDAPCEAECLSGIKKSLYDTTPTFAEPLAILPSEEVSSGTEEVGLSPIM